MGEVSAPRGFLIDLDGVLYVGDTPVPGAGDAIRFLEDSGYSYRFVSNTTRRCRHSVAARLSRMGFFVPEDLIFTPPVAAVAYMRKTGHSRFRLLVTGDVRQDFPPGESLDPAEKVDYVVLGDAGDEITYANLNGTFRDLMNGAELIALEKDRYWMAPDGLSLSAGPFVSALEFATGKTAVLMGKPSEAFFDLALRDMGIRPDEAVMIGDDIHTDVGGAKNAGMRGVLVKSGKYREDPTAESSVRPDLIINSIADIQKILDTTGEDSSDTPV